MPPHCTVTPGLHDQERTLLWDDGRKAVALEGLLGPKPPEVGDAPGKVELGKDCVWWPGKVSFSGKAFQMGPEIRNLREEPPDLLSHFCPFSVGEIAEVVVI
jgi:hypothetical protein